VQIELSWIIFVIMIAVLLEVLQQHLDEMERSGEATAVPPQRVPSDTPAPR
jgi:hypothetical protein